MARAFNGSSQYVAIYSAGNTINITGFPFSLSCFCYSTSSSAAQSPHSFGKTSAGAYYYHAIHLRGDRAGDTFQAYRIANNVGDDTPEYAGYSINTWNQVGMVVASATDCKLYVDGVQRASSSVNVVFPVGAAQWYVLGAAPGPTIGGYLAGRGAQWGAWDAALNADEMASLARGFSPRRVRPQNLKLYYPGIRENAHELVGVPVQNGGGTVADHPRSYAF